MKNNIELRFKILGVVVVLLVFSVLIRMFEKQVIDHSHYVALADNQHRFEKTELAERGRIYAHDFIENKDSLYPLAFDVKYYALLVTPGQVKDKKETAATLAPMIGLSEAEIFEKINNDKVYIPPLKHDIEYETAVTIESKNILGVTLIPENKRYYPEKNLASHVLGFVNAEGMGNYGFEGHYNKELLGTEGVLTGEQDTYGRIISLLNEKSPENGASYVLTLDRSVQYFVEKKLKEAIETYQAESGSVVIMDIESGGILAMASQPNFDPNNFKEQASIDNGVFVNPAIAYLYEPGSIFKSITMSAALDTGAVTPETKGVFGNYTVVDGYEIHTAEDKGFGEEDMTQILQNSDNVGMVWVSEKLGKENLYKYLGKFGLLDKTNIDLDK